MWPRPLAERSVWPFLSCEKTERWNRLDPRQLGQEFVIWRNDFVSSVHYDTANIPIRFDCNLELNWFHFSVLETKWIHHRCLSDRKLQMWAQLHRWIDSSRSTGKWRVDEFIRLNEVCVTNVTTWQTIHYWSPHLFNFNFNSKFTRQNSLEIMNWKTFQDVSCE